MNEFLTTFKQGVNLWRKVGFQQSIGIIILLISVIPIIVILGILLLIMASNTTIDQSDLKSMFESLVSNPPVLLLIFILLFVGLLFVLILIGTVQKIAHNHASGGFSNNEIFIIVLSKVLNLSLVGITTVIIAVIPLQLLVMILVPLKAVAPSIVGSSSGIDLDLVWDLFEAIVFSFIFALVGAPGFLSISAIVIDGANLNAFITGWKLFLKAPVSALGSMIIFWLSYLCIFLFGRFMLLNILSILIFDELVLFFVLMFFILVLLSFTLFILCPLFFTVMYSVYWDKYRMNC